MNYRARLFTYLLTFCCCLAAVGFAQSWQWTNKTLGLQGSSAWVNNTTGIAIDDADNRIIVGNFIDSIRFGSTTLISQSGTDMYVSKLDETGNFLWAKQIAGSFGGDYAVDVAVDPAVDPAGNAYMAGYFADSVNFDGTFVYQSGASNIAIAKYNNNGAVQWARLGIGAATVGGIAYSSTGHVYLGNSALLAKHTLNGDSVWTWEPQLDVQSTFQIIDIAVNDTGNYIYITGNFSFFATLGSYTLTTPDQNNTDIFVAKLDTNGSVLWAKQAGGSVPFADRGVVIEVDKAGNVYVCGSYSGTGYFDTDSIQSGDVSAIFIAKYTSTGVLEWVRGGSGSNSTSSEGQDIRMVSNDDAVVVAAVYTKSVTFGDTMYAITSGADILMLKVSASGVPEWGIQSGPSIQGIYMYAMDVDRGTETASIVGFHVFATAFGPYPLALPQNGADGYIATLATDSQTPVKERPGNTLPANFFLAQNYPNPFDPTTTIDYDIPSKSQVVITVFNVLGQQVRQLVNEVQSAGMYTVEWDGRNVSGNPVAGGVYFYRIQAGSYLEARKMLLVK